MALSLKESKAVSAMATLLYDFIPGSGDPKWKGHVSFKTIAELLADQRRGVAAAVVSTC